MNDQGDKTNFGKSVTRQQGMAENGGASGTVVGEEEDITLFEE